MKLGLKTVKKRKIPTSEANFLTYSGFLCREFMED